MIDIENNIIGIIAIIIAGVMLFLYLRDRKISSLSYNLSANTLTVSGDMSGKIKIYYEESPENKKLIENGSLVIIKLVNDGNLPIKKNDFEGTPLRISVPEDVTILSAEIIDKNPKSLNPKITKFPNYILIDPLLLNKNDSITLKFLAAGYKHSDPKDISIDARIANIDRIKTAEPKKHKSFGVLKMRRRGFDYYKIIYFLFIIVLVLTQIVPNLIGTYTITTSTDKITIPAGGSSEIIIYMIPKHILPLFNEPSLDPSRLNLRVLITDYYNYSEGIHLNLASPIYATDRSITKLMVSVDPDTRPGDYLIKIDYPLKQLTSDPTYVRVIITENESTS